MIHKLKLKKCNIFHFAWRWKWRDIYSTLLGEMRETCEWEKNRKNNKYECCYFLKSGEMRWSMSHWIWNNKSWAHTICICEFHCTWDNYFQTLKINIKIISIFVFSNNVIGKYSILSFLLMAGMDNNAEVETRLVLVLNDHL